MPITVEVSDKYRILYNLPHGTHTVILIGGRGGMKTYEASKFIAYSSTIKKKRSVILRDEKERIRQTILNEIWQRYNTANSTGRLDAIYSKNDTELKEKATGDVLIYTQGFRASDNTKTANLKGPSDIDIAVFEEAEDIRDVTKFNTFADGLRKEGCIKLILLNTPDIGHWISKRYFTAHAIVDNRGEATGYYDLIPKEIPGVVIIKSSFKDNPYLPAHTISDYNGYGDPLHHLYDLHYYNTAILGYASTGRKGQVFTKVKRIKFADYMKLPFREIYGQDFGTARPAATVGVKFDNNRAYIRLINYKPLPVLEIAKLYSTLKFDQTDRIICDYAEPDSISKLANGFNELSSEDYMLYPELARGFYAVPCPSKDIQARIGLMAGMELYIVEEHQELEDEVNNFVYAQDKYGNYTDTPIDDFNHAFFDAAGYVIVDQRGLQNMRAY